MKELRDKVFAGSKSEPVYKSIKHAYELDTWVVVCPARQVFDTDVDGRIKRIPCYEVLHLSLLK